jgi:hypothetical protein
MAMPDMAMPDMAKPDPPLPDMARPDMTPVLTCTTLYVSPQGDDAQTGCAPSTAKKTIGAALRLANQAPGSATVLVCHGSYAEPRLTSSVALRGGFDCNTWTRTTHYGYPAFDGVNESVIENADSATPTITIAGTGTLEGFAVGAPAAISCSVAVAASGNAKISNNRIVGSGSDCPGDAGSIGLFLDGPSGSADVSQNRILGGSGHSGALATGGSVGLLSRGGATPHIHANEIYGGSGSADAVSSAGSIAVLLAGSGRLTGAGVSALEDNYINGGSGSDQAGDAARAVYLSGSVSVDIIGNAIEGGDPASTITVPTHGIKAHRVGDVRVLGNRIYGGTGYASRGIEAGSNASTEIINNMIHSGPGQPTSWPIGIWLDQDGGIIRFNTIVSQEPTGIPEASMGILLTSTEANKFPIGVIIENNIIAGSGGSTTPTAFATFAVSADGCGAQGIIASFSNNLTLNATPFRYSTVVQQAVCQPKDFTSDDAIAAELTSACSPTTSGPCSTFKGAKAGGNWSLQASCAAGDLGWCEPWSVCSNVDGCLASLFRPWDPTGDGVSTLLSSGGGWRLGPNTPCHVARSSLDLSALGVEYQYDLYGTKRSAQPSMGAFEYDGTCQ